MQPPLTAPPPFTFHAESVGCGAVLADLNGRVAALELAGGVPATSVDEADVVLVQTCSFLNSAAQLSLQRVRERRLQGAGLVVALGCAVDTERAAFEALALDVGGISLEGNSSSIPAATTSPGHLHLRISRGCASACTYCSIRLTQGHVRSVPVDELVTQIRSGLPDGGTVSFLSEDVGCYGLDIGCSLPGLLDAVHAIQPEITVQIGALSPMWLSKFRGPILAAIQDGLVARDVYCPAQSGSSKVLRAMRRGYTAEDVTNAYTDLTALDCAITTDFIVGYPTETDADFAETLALAEAFPYAAVAVWAFEARAGTVGEGLPPLPAPEPARRARRLAASFAQAHLRRMGLPPAESARLVLSGKLPLRSNVNLFGAA